MSIGDQNDFLKKHENNKKQVYANLTEEQIKTVEWMARSSGLSFEDTVMILVQFTLQDLAPAARRAIIEEQAKRN